MDAANVAANTSPVLEISKECENAHIAAEDMVTQIIEKDIENAKTEADKKKALVQKRADWPAKRISELEEEIKKAQDHAKRYGEYPYCQYQKERLSHFVIRLESTLSLCGHYKLNEAESKLLPTAMIPIKLTDIIDTAKALHDNFPSDAHQLQQKYDALLKKFHSFLVEIAQFNYNL